MKLLLSTFFIYIAQQEMNKLNNQRCSLHSILLSLSILLTLLFIAIGAAADGDFAAGLRESGNLTKPVR